VYAKNAESLVWQGLHGMGNASSQARLVSHDAVHMAHIVPFAAIMAR
jgi:hypothetical protein